ncbi:MAG: hypothetical protein JXR58_04560 [Bacteroidales bacterium]|nr:hypothetical protein [Bacteroidales bacterium]
MKNDRGFSGLLVFYVFVILFTLYGEIFGIIHSYNKHSKSDLIATIFIPPWAWYRSVEMWWHEDESEAIAEEIIDDTELFMRLLSMSSEETKLEEVNEVINELSISIEEYPDEKKNSLMEKARLYYDFNESVSDDLLNSIYAYFDSGVFEWIISENTSKLEAELIENGLDFQVKLYESTKKEIQSTFVKKDPQEFTDKEARKMIDNLIHSIDNQKATSRKTFKRLFREDL